MRRSRFLETLHNESLMQQLVTSSSMVGDPKWNKTYCFRLGPLIRSGCDFSWTGALVVPSVKSHDGQTTVYVTLLSVFEIPNVPRAALILSGNKFDFISVPEEEILLFRYAVKPSQDLLSLCNAVFSHCLDSFAFV